MLKRVSLVMIIALSISLVGCKSNKEVKEDMYLAGIIVDINDNEISVESGIGEYKFDISECIIESENDLAVDDSCEIYYSEELNDEEVNKANKVVSFFDGYLIGEITNIEDDVFTIKADGASYKFKLDESCDVKINELDLSQIYDVEFDKKLSSQEINIAKELNLLEVDDAPIEELELVENFNGVVEE